MKGMWRRSVLAWCAGAVVVGLWARGWDQIPYADAAPPAQDVPKVVPLPVASPPLTGGVLTPAANVATLVPGLSATPALPNALATLGALPVGSLVPTIPPLPTLPGLPPLPTLPLLPAEPSATQMSPVSPTPTAMAALSATATQTPAPTAAPLQPDVPGSVSLSESHLLGSAPSLVRLTLGAAPILPAGSLAAATPAPDIHCTISASLTPSGDPYGPTLSFGGTTGCDGTMDRLAADGDLHVVVNSQVTDPAEATAPHQECGACQTANTSGSHGPEDAGTTHRSFYRTQLTPPPGYVWVSYDPAYCSASGATLSCTVALDYTVPSRPITCTGAWGITPSGNQFQPTLSYRGAASCSDAVPQLEVDASLHVVSGGQPTDPPVSTAPHQSCSGCQSVETSASFGPATSGVTYREVFRVTRTAPAGWTWSSYDPSVCTASGNVLTCTHTHDYTVPIAPPPTPTPTATPLPTATPVTPPSVPVQPAPPGTGLNPPDPNGGYSPDPVHSFSGAYSYTFTDLSIAGRGPSPMLARTYNSNDPRVGVLGPAWTHSYEVRLRSPGDQTGDVLLVGPQGRSDRYARNPDSTFTPPLGSQVALVKNGDGTWTATLGDQTKWTFADGTGRLTTITDRHGNQAALTYDGSGQLTTVADPARRGSLTLAYNACFAGRLCSVTDWTGRVVRYEYDASGRLARVINREGQATTFGYDGTTHRMTSITDARDNAAVTNAYDGQGRVMSQMDARGRLTGQQTLFTYGEPDGSGNRTTIVTLPPASADLSWRPLLEDTYDAQGRLTKRVSKPSRAPEEWATEQYTYNAIGFRASVTDPRGNTTLFCYDVDYNAAAIPGSRGNLTRIIQPLPATGAVRPVTLFKYDSKNNVIQIVPPRGLNFGSAACNSILGGGVNAQYAVDLAYDAAQARLLSVTRRFTDPDAGQKTAVTKYEYGDAANPGSVTRVIAPLGNTSGSPDYGFATTLTYFTSGSQAGMTASLTDPLGNKSTYTYDGVGRRTSLVDPKGNAAGAIPAEHTWTYEYDNEDRVRFSRAPAPSAGGSALTIEARYDAAGNRVVAIDAAGQVTKYAYDERDGLKDVRQSRDPWSDPNVPSGEDIATAYSYDDLGNLTRVVRAQGEPGEERVIDYVYDGANRLRKETQYPNWPNTGAPLVTEVTYDTAGNRQSARDPLGQTTTFGYDPLNRLTSITYGVPAPGVAETANVSYLYDQSGNRTRMTDGVGTTSYTYDEQDRLLSVAGPLSVRSVGTCPGAGTTVGYRYDLDGNRTKLIYPDCRAVAYTFDKADRPQASTDWANRITSYAYGPDGALTGVTNPNGTAAAYAYDNAGRLLDVWHKRGAQTVSRHTYTLDANGNRTTLHDVQALSGSGTANPHVDVNLPVERFVRYGYDQLSQLTEATTALTDADGAPGGVTAGAAVPVDRTNYTYDAAGNRTNMVRRSAGAVPVSTTTYAYDRADRISSSTLLTGSASPAATAYTSDANGNLLTRRTNAAGQPVGDGDAFIYDQANRLARASVLSVSALGATAQVRAIYGYDGDGKRMTVTAAAAPSVQGSASFNAAIPQSIASYVYDVSQSLPVTLMDGQRAYVWGANGLAYSVILNAGATASANAAGMTITTDGGLEIYHTDGLGSVRALTDLSGAVAQTYQTDEFGVPVPAGTTGASLQPFQFAGEPRDPETGLYYLRARMYEPTIGRFFQRDPLAGSSARPQSLHRFTYVRNDPVNAIDPSGLAPNKSIIIRNPAAPLACFWTWADGIALVCVPAWDVVEAVVGRGNWECVATGYWIDIATNTTIRGEPGYGRGSSRQQAVKNAYINFQSKVPPGHQGKHIQYHCTKQ